MKDEWVRVGSSDRSKGCKTACHMHTHNIFDSINWINALALLCQTLLYHRHTQTHTHTYTHTHTLTHTHTNTHTHKHNQSFFLSFFLFSCGHATLTEALSIHPSVRRTMGQNAILRDKFHWKSLSPLFLFQIRMIRPTVRFITWINILDTKAANILSVFWYYEVSLLVKNENKREGHFFHFLILYLITGTLLWLHSTKRKCCCFCCFCCCCCCWCCHFCRWWCCRCCWWWCRCCWWWCYCFCCCCC